MVKAAAIVLLGAFLSSPVGDPERKVKGNVITSERDPALQITLPTSAQYLGAQRWVLCDMADCELHAFVDADPQKRVERFYWVQFEGHLPTRPELKHTYDAQRHANLAGLDFYVDDWVRAKDAETARGSDIEHIMAMIQEKGYRMPEGMRYVRLVHLRDERKRKELMIIYGEDVAEEGLKAPDLNREVEQMIDGRPSRMGCWRGRRRRSIFRLAPQVRIRFLDTNLGLSITCGACGAVDRFRRHLTYAQWTKRRPASSPTPTREQLERAGWEYRNLSRGESHTSRLRV